MLRGCGCCNSSLAPRRECMYNFVFAHLTMATRCLGLCNACSVFYHQFLAQKICHPQVLDINLIEIQSRLNSRHHNVKDLKKEPLYIGLQGHYFVVQHAINFDNMKPSHIPIGMDSPKFREGDQNNQPCCWDNVKYMKIPT